MFYHYLFLFVNWSPGVARGTLAWPPEPPRPRGSRRMLPPPPLIWRMLFLTRPLSRGGRGTCILALPFSRASICSLVKEVLFLCNFLLRRSRSWESSSVLELCSLLPSLVTSLLLSDGEKSPGGGGKGRALERPFFLVLSGGKRDWGWVLCCSSLIYIVFALVERRDTMALRVTMSKPRSCRRT